MWRQILHIILYDAANPQALGKNIYQWNQIELMGKPDPTRAVIHSLNCLIESLYTPHNASTNTGNTASFDF